MPSERKRDTSHDLHTGRCYCGALCISATEDPLTVAYCHCADCRRWTGSPLPAFAGIADAAVSLPKTDPLELSPGVQRWACGRCGSPLAARFAYLPGQT
ncbi:GFA family protein [Sagittula stellata]|uniref:Glutathione-dependent formaldehyde-activating, GFA n=1 Tax=Sagittula stellata (strain ATCC 700073 / DSM 11524 / E-37) TaxID=388399 RepID=A3K404_SAGS3|nr:GFA family protein [Sagittula stellata]EBA08268.1 glutathione-dependent formaldehyde-activating, GFA [Sagittula stellata E-37]